MDTGRIARTRGQLDFTVCEATRESETRPCVKRRAEIPEADRETKVVFGNFAGFSLQSEKFEHREMPCYMHKGAELPPPLPVS